MKILLYLFILIPGLCFSAAKPSPSPTKSTIVHQGLVCRTKQDDLLLRDWINGLINQVHQAQAENDLSNKSNTALQTELAASQKAATALANECAADKACAKAPLSCWFHRLLKHIIWVVAILVVGGILLSIFLPGASAFFVFIWKWILKLFSPKTP